ncbi:S-(+)-linalool synthase [Citrus sinensis]|uniref:S-(+)-linalool synthase n=1 Tax=Citrus sinensis TaxID=2711 RepID=A0ACB8N4R9_CITSI|nr:S-(+)-linalool synthase [Citrus sinensis]
MPTTSCVSLRLGPLVSLRTRSWQQGRSLHSNSLSCICQLSSLPKPLVTDFKTSPRQNVLTYEGDRGTKSLEEELQERTRKALRKSSNDPTATMKLIDTIQRLGIGYHFEDEIMERLERFSDGDAAGEENLFENALRFRLLRQNGLPACTDIFKKFINKEGKLKESVSKDTRDFNMVQSLHQRELAEIKRWWKQLGLVDKLGFGRDRPLECFLWTVGIFPEPYYSNCRIELAKTIALLLVIDDIFDTYGSLSDLVLFTEAIQRWDLGAMEHIPEYMKICYMALYNTTNEISYRILKDHGWNVVPQLKRTWIDIFKAQLSEAKWFSEGYVPTQEQYLRNGVTTGGTYMALVHAFCLMGQGVTKETLAMMEPYPNLFSCSGKILRLWDDLGTAREEQERGDVASSIECYMREKTISCEEEARKHIRQLIRSLWVELNGMLVAPAALPASIVNASLNLARTAQVVYQHGDDSTVTSVNGHIERLFYNPLT